MGFLTSSPVFRPRPWWCLFLLIGIHSFAQDPSKQAEELKKVVAQSTIDPKHLGLVVATLGQKNDQPLFELNGDVHFIPASLTKIVTAAAVLEKLGVTRKLQTELWSSGSVQNGELKGDIILKGGGDPGFVSESMWFLVNEFLRTGVRKVVGDIIVDDEYFDNVRFDPSREPSRIDRAYDSPIGAMSFNWNVVNVYVRPGAKAKAQAQAYLDPENDFVKLVNTATTYEGRGKDLEVRRKSGEAQDDGMQVGDEIHIKGRIGLEFGEAAIYKNISQPDLWSGYNLQSFLRQRGVMVTGSVRAQRGAAQRATRMLAKAESKPMGQLVADMLKFSNNFVAEMLTKTLGAEMAGAPGTMPKGLEHIRDWLTEAGIAKDSYTLINPSGLTRKNSFKPKQLLSILDVVHDRFAYYPEFLSALPLAGQDGTLKKRMGNQSKAFVRAKTGLLNGVVGLAGYAGTSQGELRSFVFIFNGPASQAEKARNLFDKLAGKLF